MKLREHTIRLQGEKTTLRPLTEDDWDILLKWNNDPEVLFFSENDDVSSYDLESVQRIYRGVSRNAFCFVIESQGSPVGECWLQKMNLRRVLDKYPGKDCRRIDIMIGEKGYWGQGLGTEAIGVLVEFGFYIERADFIFACDVADYNTRSIKAFEKNGFRLGATFKQPPGNKAGSLNDLVLSREGHRLLKHN